MVKNSHVFFLFFALIYTLPIKAEKWKGANYVLIAHKFSLESTGDGKAKMTFADIRRVAVLPKGGVDNRRQGEYFIDAKDLAKEWKVPGALGFKEKQPYGFAVQKGKDGLQGVTMLLRNVSLEDQDAKPTLVFDTEEVSSGGTKIDHSIEAEDVTLIVFQEIK